MEDKQIVELYWMRSESAISETDKKYGRYCRYIAYQILCNDEDSEEVVNDTYLKTWNTVPPNRPDPLKAYVGRISNQLAIDRYDYNHAEKRGGGEMPLVLEELSDCVSDPSDSTEPGDSVALKDALNRFLRSLPKRTRMIFVRRYWYISSVTDIATEYGMKESAVAMLMLRTRKKLQAFLSKEGFDL